jgi:predicted nucleic acid-binding protein
MNPTSQVPSAADDDVVIYDSGALIAISDERSRTALSRHRDRILSGARILVPAVVAAQVVRRPATQARLMRALAGCEIVPFTAAHHTPVGRLLAASGTADVVDAFVAVMAATFRARVISSDTGDIGHLLNCLGVRLPVFRA